MERRAGTSATTRSIRSAVVANGADEASVAEAADMTLDDLNAHLDGVTEFTVAELVHVGGFLRIPINKLFTEAA